MAIFLLAIYPFLFTAKKSFADEITLFPTECSGTWLQSQDVAGDPTDSFSSFGAKSQSVGDSIVCRNFIGSLPEGAEITNSYVKLFWSQTATNQEYSKPSIEESYDLTPLPLVSPSISPQTLENIISDEKIDQSNDKIDNNKDSTDTEKKNEKVDIINSSPQPEKVESQPAQIESKTPQIQSEGESKKEIEAPTSRLPAWIHSFFIKKASAQETVDNISNNNGSGTPITVDSEQPLQEDKSTQTDELTQKNEVFVDKLDSNQLQAVDQKEIEISGDTQENNLMIDDQEEVNQPIIQSGGVEIVQPTSGTPLFRLSYSEDGVNQQPAGFVIHENLSEQYILALQSTDFENFSFSLERLMTLDDISNLTLLGVGLVVQYSGIILEDPIRQPDLNVDIILDSIIFDSTQVIRLKRADKKGYEIWYRNITSEEEMNTGNSIKNNQEISLPETEHIVLEDKLDEQSVVKNTETGNIDEDVEKNINNEEEKETEMLEDDKNIKDVRSLEIDLVSDIVKAEVKTIPELQETSIIIRNEIDNSYWNFVVGDDSVNESFPIDFRDNTIFWINKKGTVVNAFNVSTQGILSQSLQAGVDNQSLIYFDATSKEKNVVISFSEQRFIFPE